VEEDCLTMLHGGRIEDVAVVRADDSDTRLGWRWTLDCRLGFGRLSDAGAEAEAEVPER